MKAAFADNLADNHRLDSSRQGLQSSRLNPFEPLAEKFERRHQNSFGLVNLHTQSLPGLLVQISIQGIDLPDEIVPRSFGVSITEKNPPKAATVKYFKNGILVRRSDKTIYSEDVANALAEE